MLRAYILEYKRAWDDHLPFIEFSYNNSYQASIEMTPFEALYGRICTTPFYWTEAGEPTIIKPELLQEMEETLKNVIDKLQRAQYRYKAYANKKMRPLEFVIEYFLQVKHRSFDQFNNTYLSVQ